MLYPLNTVTRTKISLNGIWKFAIQTPKLVNDVATPLDSEQLMAVPASFNDQTTDSKIRQHNGYFWYERSFNVPQVLLQEHLSLRFGSATHEAWVYVNGREVGHHKGGFTPFELSIDDVINAGKNRLTVKLSNLLDYTTLPVGNYSEDTDENGNVVAHVDENFDFFNYAGLHRNVDLLATPKNRIEDITIVPSVDVQNLRADVSLQVKTTHDVGRIQVSILDQSGVSVGQAEGSSTRILLQKVHLWQPLKAYLYQAHVQLFDGDQLVDDYCEPFGIRSLETKDGQFLINGAPFYFKGFGKHEDTYVNGKGLNEAYNVLDLNLLKKMGANSFRTSHYPYSEEMMRLCDQEGIVVIDEVPAVGLIPAFNFDISGAMAKSSQESPFWTDEIKTNAAHQQVIQELIARDKNHASVVLWSLFNEPASYLKGAHDYFEPLFKEARQLDPQTRPCTFVNIMFSKPETDECTDLVDIIALNRYYGWYVNTGDLATAAKNEEDELLRWQAKFPDKPIMFTEFGADTIAGMHSAYNEPFSEEYQVNYYKMNAQVFDKVDHFVGEQLWNFADFQTKVGIQRVQGNKKGIFTRAREPKSAASWLSQRWNKISNFNYKTKR